MGMELSFWLIAIAVFAVVEMATVGLVTIWFAIGSLTAFVAAVLGAPFWLQITLFLAVSIVLLLCLRNYIQQKIKPSATNVDAVVGQIAVVTTDIDNVMAQGQVKLGPMEWTARSTSGKPIAAGAKVRVDRVEGVKVFVTPADVAAKV